MIEEIRGQLASARAISTFSIVWPKLPPISKFITKQGQSRYFVVLPTTQDDIKLMEERRRLESRGNGGGTGTPGSNSHISHSGSGAHYSTISQSTGIDDLTIQNKAGRGSINGRDGEKHDLKGGGDHIGQTRMDNDDNDRGDENEDGEPSLHSAMTTMNMSHPVPPPKLMVNWSLDYHHHKVLGQ
jgi:hypothetical protein